MTRASWTVVRLVVALAIIAYVLRGFDAPAAARALSGFSLGAACLSLALIAADRGLMLWRWVMLVGAIRTLPPHGLGRVFFVSSFLGSFMPAGVGGDAARAFQVGRRSNQVGAAIASVVVDRWLGLLAVGASGCVGVLVSLAAVPLELRELTIALTVLLALGMAAALYADRIADRLLPAPKHDGRLTRGIRRLAAAMAVYRQSPCVLWRVAGLSLLVQAVRITLAWAIGKGLGISLPFSYYWVFMPLNILIILLPLSLGGFGLPQGTMVWTLTPLGVRPTEALLLSLLFVLAGVVGNLPGAVLYAFGHRSIAAAPPELVD